MAGIEKICEYSGEYCGPDMYNWKYNNIQIKPEYRKLFRGAKAKLIICGKRPVFLWNGGGTTAYYSCNKTGRESYLSLENWIDQFPYNAGRFGYQWDYELVVDNENLQGNVAGRYHNHTTDIQTTKRKLKRLLRAAKLEVLVDI